MSAHFSTHGPLKQRSPDLSAGPSAHTGGLCGAGGQPDAVHGSSCWVEPETEPRGGAVSAGGCGVLGTWRPGRCTGHRALCLGGAGSQTRTGRARVSGAASCSGLYASRCAPRHGRLLAARPGALALGPPEEPPVSALCPACVERRVCRPRSPVLRARLEVCRLAWGRVPAVPGQPVTRPPRPGPPSAASSAAGRGAASPKMPVS